MKKDEKVVMLEAERADMSLFSELAGLIVECHVRDRPKPICGRLEKVTPQYLLLRRLHGTPTIVNRESVEVITPTKANYIKEAV